MKMRIRMKMNMRMRLKMGMVLFGGDRYEIVVAAVARASRSFLLFSAQKEETTAAPSQAHNGVLHLPVLAVCAA